MVKTLVTSLAVGMVLVAVMQYMGVPVPSAHDVLGGISRLAHLN
jgi:phosphate/sulfate permease